MNTVLGNVVSAIFVVGFGISSCCSSAAVAQELVLTSSILVAGGGESSGGASTVVSSIGQSDAGESEGGNFGVLGGFLAGAGEQAVLLGDVNQDGAVNLLDVGPFVDVLTGGEYQVEADVNQDGFVNLLNVGPFVDILTG